MLKSEFENFCENIKLNNKEDIENTVSEIAKKLNRHYYNIDESIEHMYIVGSVGRTTAIKNVSDIDIIFDLPEGIYSRINDNEGNKQSQLLQEVKNVLLERYPKTDLRGDGQVIVIKFTKYTIELVPGFKQEDESFKYPDTNDGGSWKLTKPILEINKCKKLDYETNGNFSNICHMLRVWKNNIGLVFKGLLIDTLVNIFFNEYPQYKKSQYDEYYNLVKDLFYFLKSENKKQKFWFALGSNQKIEDNGNFISKAEKEFKKLENVERDSEKVNKILRGIFGVEFPYKQKNSRTKYEDTEEFIENLYSVDILIKLILNCHVEQNGYHSASKLKALLKNPFFFLKKDAKLIFFIENEEELKKHKVDKILWKVKNEGDEAKRLDMIRGQIYETNIYTQNEHTDFNGCHYVEAYAIKNNICVARGRINVPIKV